MNVAITMSICYQGRVMKQPSNVTRSRGDLSAPAADRAFDQLDAAAQRAHLDDVARRALARWARACVRHGWDVWRTQVAACAACEAQQERAVAFHCTASARRSFTAWAGATHAVQ